MIYSTTLCCAVLCCAAGKRVSDVAPKLTACVEPFGVNLVEGVMSHVMKQVSRVCAMCVVVTPSCCVCT
jgi:hypothetical protein